MAKLRIPLLSLDARNTLGRAITFVRRRKQNIAEQIPIPDDPRTLAQLSWRHMYTKAVALWHALSAAEKRQWESSASPRHMTGFAWFMSQALKPNPGLYLPFQGGTMSGDIDMAKNRILKLPLPLDSQEALTLAYFTANIAPYLYHEGARVYHTVIQSIPNIVTTYHPFASERWDNDAIHDNVVNNSRLTCKTAGKYIIIGNIKWTSNAVGYRRLVLYHNATTTIAQVDDRASTVSVHAQIISTIYDLAVNDFVELGLKQSSGAALNTIFTAEFAPEFMMERIGA